MEILAVNESYLAAIILGSLLVLALICTTWVVFAKDSEIPIRIVSGLLTLIVLVGIGLIIADPVVVTYDAIVTDWNEVHEQGYEVVKKNGEIVTLRKVDE